MLGAAALTEPLLDLDASNIDGGGVEVELLDDLVLAASKEWGLAARLGLGGVVLGGALEVVGQRLALGHALRLLVAGALVPCWRLRRVWRWW